MRALHVIVVAFSLVSATAVADVAPSPTASSAMTDALQTCRPRDTCCKVCSKGQACGNSCISRTKNCHQPPGCACDAADVCG
jgi:hypothetical protein